MISCSTCNILYVLCVEYRDVCSNLMRRDLARLFRGDLVLKCETMGIIGERMLNLLHYLSHILTLP